jgi:glucose/arabinose dehydrogenase/mono/diheme cytochrome c family protein
MQTFRCRKPFEQPSVDTFANTRKIISVIILTMKSRANESRPRFLTRYFTTAFMALMAAFPQLSLAQGAASPAAGGLKLPAGFSSVVVAENLGRTRHLVVTPQADIYVRLARPVKGKGTLLLHETAGKADVVYGFGDATGTGIVLRDGYLYTASNTEVFRYKLDAKNRVAENAVPERIVTGLVAGNEHETKSLAMDAAGNLFVTVGAPSNSCQEQDRQRGSMGIKGCPLLATAGGVWMFKADKKDQTYADGFRYATGLRNVVGLDWNAQANKLFVMQHGRDQLNTIAPDYYNVKDNAELPAECMFALSQGDDAGWPYIYYDPMQKKKMVAPEYGGDGKRDTSAFLDPAAAYPAHMAPNGLVFYTGTQFPERYRNGAFIAFHGSWNRSPEPQAGYFVVFQPFKNGMPSGDCEVFADNFSGSPEKTASGRADHRPCGLAIGPDGSLYVSDDSKGSIFKITYNNGEKRTTGNALAASASDEAKAVKASNRSTKTIVKKTTSSNSAKSSTSSTAAKTSTTAASVKGSVAAGKMVYMQTCVTCHQPDGGGVQNMNPSLIKSSFVRGSKTTLINTVLNGMKGKEIGGETYHGVMPSMAYLSDKQIADVTTYVRNSFGNKGSAVTTSDVKRLRPKK